jgi:hypothetical protein
MSNGLRLGSGRAPQNPFLRRLSEKQPRGGSRDHPHSRSHGHFSRACLAGFYSSPSLATDGDNSGKQIIGHHVHLGRRRPGRPGHPRLFQRQLPPRSLRPMRASSMRRHASSSLLMFAQRRATAMGAYAALYSEDDDEGSYDDGTYERVTRAPGCGDEGCF